MQYEIKTEIQFIIIMVIDHFI